MSKQSPYRFGRILRAHGLKGDLLLQLYRPRSFPVGVTRSHAGEPITLRFRDRDDRPLQLTVAKAVDSTRLVVHFRRIDDRTVAEALIGGELDADTSALPTLLADEADHLVGAQAYVVEGGAELGPVVEIRDNGAQAILVIGDDEILIPFVPNFVGALEEGPSGKRLPLSPIPGLLEVNQE